MRRLQLTSLEEAESLADGTSPLGHALDRVLARDRLLHLIRRLDALDHRRSPTDPFKVALRLTGRAMGTRDGC